MPASADPDITTVVMSRNRRADVLSTLGRHSRPVVLVDNASTDGTVEAVRLLHPDVLVISLPANAGAPARNLGVRAAETPYVAFADDDSWWEPGSLEAAVSLLDEHETVGLLAARILVGPEDRLDPISTQMADSPLPQRTGVPGAAVLGFVACGCIVRKEAFLGVGGFDDVVFFPGEEQRVAYDLAAAGWDLAYVDELVVHHHPSTTRSSDAVRQRLIDRNALLTALMRRPWPVVGRQTWRTVTSSWEGARAAALAIPRVPAALARRRLLPAEVESRVRKLETIESRSAGTSSRTR
ncbi:MAG: glycosyltransferase [Nocardioidaceae bacterium]|nr:glycosyltransferase [Nocardioidaceae bacterium]